MTVSEIAAAAGPAAMLLIWATTHWRDRIREGRAEVALDAVDRVKLEKIEQLDQGLQKHLLECTKAHTQHIDAIHALTKATDRLERSVGQLQAQIRNIATASHNRVFIAMPKDEPA